MSERWEFRGPPKSTAQIARTMKATTNLWEYDATTYGEDEEAAQAKKVKR